MLFPVPSLSDSLSALSMQCRFWQSLSVCLSTGRSVAGLPSCTSVECSRGVSVLSRLLWRKFGLLGDAADKLAVLSLLYDLERDASLVADYAREAEWSESFESVAAPCLSDAPSVGERLRIRLCRCLSDYFYFDPSAEDDSWFQFLRDTVRGWAGSFSSVTGWGGLSLPDALERVEVMNRYSYMFLDPSCDAVTGSAYVFYRSGFSLLPASSYGLYFLYHTLSLEGHALPADEELAETIVSRLSLHVRQSPGAREAELCLLSCLASSGAFRRLEPEIA